MPASLPAEIRELLTTTVLWESFLGFDGHAEPTYAAAIAVVCWQEAHGTSSASGGLEVFRRADGTVVEPSWDLYFSGDDPNARKMQVYDRFTPGGIGTDPSQRLQAVRINTMLGPPFDHRNPWIVQVTL